MKNTFSQLTAAMLLCFSLAPSYAHAADPSNATRKATSNKSAASQLLAAPGEPSAPPPAGTVFVQAKFGGQIFGYDVDRNGTEGMLSEISRLADGNLLIATETFDQKTGKILKIVSKKTETQDNFITLGIVENHIGLQQDQQSKGLFVQKRTYNTINPLDGNLFTGTWNPPLNDKTELFEDVEGDQGHPGVAVMASTFNCCSRFVFSSNVSANTFGQKITLTDPLLSGGVPPLMAFDTATNQAVLSQAQGAPFDIPVVAIVDFASGTVTEFNGAGFGFVNGLAVDSATGIACTTTETDNSAEFYDLATKTGFSIQLPLIGQFSAGSVAVDPVHKLFFITHPVPAAPGEIHIYDENANLIKSLSGFVMGPAGLYVALNPHTRTGFVQVPGPNGNSSALQSFSY